MAVGGEPVEHVGIDRSVGRLILDVSGFCVVVVLPQVVH
jgi:hypothetical protein